MNVRTIELTEDAIDIRLDPARKSVPVIAGYAMRESLDLEIVLDIDCHRITDGHGIGVSRRVTAPFPLPPPAF